MVRVDVLVRVGRIELPFTDWQPVVLPLNYTRVSSEFYCIASFLHCKENPPTCVGGFSLINLEQVFLYFLVYKYQDLWFVQSTLVLLYAPNFLFLHRARRERTFAFARHMSPLVG